MNRLHCARYTIPTRRSPLQRLVRAIELAYLRWCLRSVVDERDGYLKAEEQARAELGDAFEPIVGPEYLANSKKQEDELNARIALLEVHS